MEFDIISCSHLRVDRVEYSYSQYAEFRQARSKIRSWGGLGWSVQGSGKVLGAVLKNKKQHRAAKRRWSNKRHPKAAKRSKEKQR